MLFYPKRESSIVPARNFPPSTSYLCYIILMLPFKYLIQIPLAHAWLFVAEYATTMMNRRIYAFVDWGRHCPNLISARLQYKIIKYNRKAEKVSIKVKNFKSTTITVGSHPGYSSKCSSPTAISRAVECLTIGLIRAHKKNHISKPAKIIMIPCLSFIRSF